jgi:hypothetical protein
MAARKTKSTVIDPSTAPENPPDLEIEIEAEPENAVLDLVDQLKPAEPKKVKYRRDKSSTPKKYYVTNAQLLEAFHEAKALGRLTDRMARYLQMIAERYSYHPWFVGYSYRDDMVAAAVVNLVANWHKFNPEKSDNPFAYYTTASYRSFLSYLDAERRERDIRDELLIEAGSNPSFNYQDRHSGKSSDDTAFTGSSPEE